MSPLNSTTTSKNTGHQDAPSKSSSMQYKPHLMYSLDPAANARSVFGDVSNTVPPRPTLHNIEGTSMDDPISPLSYSCSDVTFHLHRVADNHGFLPTEIRHNTGACTHEWQAHNSKFRSPVTPSSLGSNGATPEDPPATNSSWSCFAPTPSSAHMWQTVEHNPFSHWLCEDTVSRLRDVVPPVPPGLPHPCAKRAATFGPWSPEDLCEDLRRTSEIRPRVVGATAATSFKPGGYIGTTVTSPAADPVIPGVTVGPFYDDALLKALADWTSECLYKLMIEPHIQQGFKFQYHGKPHQTSAWVARRLCPVIRQMYNPVQIVIHALCFIGTLASDDTYQHADGSFFSVPFFRHLRSHGTYTAEDFMFRAFVVCAMIGDKSVNDVTFTTKSWKRLTSIPNATLNAMETIALTLLEWDVVMTMVRWQESIIYFRTCINKSDPFGPTALLLAEMATLSGADAARDSLPVIQPPLEIIAPQPISAFTQWQLYIPPEWCPEDDPIVNQKPRTIGIAPGVDQRSSVLTNGTTAKDLLDMILGSSGAPGFAHLGRSAGTSFYGSFGAVGARVTQTAKHASASSTISWIPAQG